MRTRFPKLPLVLSCVVLLLASGGMSGCAQPAGPAGVDGEDLEMVDPGKADNYYSTVAVEYKVTGSVPVTMTAEQYADQAERNQIVLRRLTAVGLYLTTYLTDKFRGIDINYDGEITEDEVFFHNEKYGGFHAMVRNRTTQATTVTGDAEHGFQAEFAIDVAGPKNMLALIPRAAGGEPGSGFPFEFKMPADATSDPNNVARREIRNFNPETYAGELLTVRCLAKQNPEVVNSYPQYQAFMSDGVFDITLFYGHDYNKSRSDLSEAQEAFYTLAELGFTTPVEKFEDLKGDSGPFVLTLVAGGKQIRVEARVFHSDMFTEARKAQHDLALSELATRDVFFYNGHAGPYYGFYLDAADAAKVYPNELAAAAFTDKQQLFIAQGCQTYSQYADNLYASEVKSEGNLDVITTVNYSYGRGAMGILRDLVAVDRDGNHTPVDYYGIVNHLNSDWINSSESVFYGVVGIEENPRLHPYASVESIGKRCQKRADCGDVGGNVCVAGESGGKRCGGVALADTACPESTRFRELASSGVIKTGACFAER